MVFTTAYDKFAVAAFELEAIDYLLKPFGRDRLLAALERVKRAVRDDGDVPGRAPRARGDGPAVGHRAADAHLRPRSRANSARRRRATSSASRPTTTTSPCPRRGRRYLVYLGMNEFEARLDPARFLRIHRSHIVNLDHVAALVPFDATRLQIEMQDGTKLIASRTRSRELRGLAI